MAVMAHEHQWRWNPQYFEDPVDPVHCLEPKCSATLSMKQLIRRAQMVERLLAAYAKGGVEAGIAVMVLIREWDVERESWHGVESE